ncbi:hypothetical protein BKA69DRAFT_1043750 [Paraphysoderma sedebokerense]|nr:hypothetical protein BKA69DRAFT_1043750 [Paraphysoderma sedebokerense]
MAIRFKIFETILPGPTLHFKTLTQTSEFLCKNKSLSGGVDITMILIRILILISLIAMSAVTGRKVTYEQNAFYLDGKPTILRGGTMQWFRMAPKQWEPRLKQFKAMGFNTVDIYINWALTEPVEGQFDFKTYDLGRFLRLANELGLYIYFRPGPYITNELDAGGVPAWVIAKTSKKTRNSERPDGTVNPRTNDYEWIDLTRKYYTALNRFIMENKFLYTQGGPIVLYAVENEYDWFDMFFQVDKLADLDGEPERDRKQIADTAGYFRNLRDIVESTGIDVPITTCPGTGQAKDTGDVPRVLPIPNVYAIDVYFEYNAQKLLKDMHNPANHGGAYVKYPTGATETERDITTSKRLLISGFDVISAFNIMPFQHDGYQNSMAINGAFVRDFGKLMGLIRNIANFSHVDRIRHAFLRPELGLFYNNMDYYGAVDFHGIRRERFFEHRIFNLFVNSFQDVIALAGAAKRTTAANIQGKDNRVMINDPRVGIVDPDSGNKRVTYFLDLGQERGLIGLLNQQRKNIVLEKNSITAFKYKFPKYTKLTIPLQYNFPNQQSSIFPTDETFETQYMTYIPINFRFGNLRLDYSTAEIVCSKKFGDEMLLIVYGPRGAQGEIQISSEAEAKVDFISGIKMNNLEKGDGLSKMTISFTFESGIKWMVMTSNGQKHRIIVVDRYNAGRVWFPRKQATSLVIFGPDFVDEDSIDLNMEFNEDSTIYTLSESPVILQDNSIVRVQGHHDGSKLTVFRHKYTSVDTSMGSLLANGYIKSDESILSNSYNYVDAGFRNIFRPTPLEKVGIYTGTAWYKAEFTLSQKEYDDYTKAVESKRRPAASLYVEHAADMLGIYVNGKYVTSVFPFGTEVDSNGPSYYRFTISPDALKVGRNVILFKTEIWGRGCSMFFRGKLKRIPGPSGSLIPLPMPRFDLPSTGFDSSRGLWGKATFNGKPLEQWSVRQWFDGQKMEFWDDNVRGWEKGSLPKTLKPGQLLWYKVIVTKAELFREDQVAPVVIHLRGSQVKASIYVNGKLLGRWLSDDETLTRGSWVKPLRNMWSKAAPDEIPITPESLHDNPKTKNVIAFLFEDLSAQTVEALSQKGHQAGVINRFEFGFPEQSHRHRHPETGKAFDIGTRKVTVRVANV